jgi:hypothetical protein
VVVAANFGVLSTSFSVNFPAAGKYYNYFTRDSITVSGTSQTISFQPGQYYLWTSKFLPEAPALITTSTRAELQAQYKLEVFPNPTQGAAQIRFELPEATQVKVELFNNLGQNVGTVHNGYLNAGQQQLRWNQALNPGVYQVRLQVNQGVLTQTLLVQ